MMTLPKPDIRDPSSPTRLKEISSRTQKITPDIGGNAKLIPKISIPDKVVAQLTQRLTRSLIIKISEPFKVLDTLKERISSMWKIKGGLQLCGLSYGFYIVYGLLEEDRTRIITAQPWRLGKSSILIRSWILNFDLELEARKAVTAIWMSIKNLPVQFHTL